MSGHSTTKPFGRWIIDSDPTLLGFCAPTIKFSIPVTPVCTASVLLLLIVLASPSFGRHWTDKSGKFGLEAELISVRNQNAYLERSDGAVITVPLAKLSKADLEYLLSLNEYRDYFRENPIPGLEDASRMAVIHVDDPSKVGEVRRFEDLGWGVKSLAFSPDGRFLAVGKMDRAVILYDVDRSTRVSFIDKLENLGAVTCLAFTPDGRKLLAGGDTGRIQIWKVESNGQLLEANRFVGHADEIDTITVSTAGTTVLSGGREKKVRCWDLESARESFVIDGFKDDVKASFINRSGSQGLACDEETLVLIDMEKGEVIQRMKLGRGASQAVAISPDGSRVTVSDSYALRVWNIKSGMEFPKLQSNEIQWTAVFSQDGRYILSGGSGKVSLWEVDTQRALYEFDTEGTYYVQTIAYSPDRRHFAAIPASAGQNLQVFRLPAEFADTEETEPTKSSQSE